MNKIMIIGNLARDPELRTTPQGISVCTFTVAVGSKQFKSPTGERESDFFRVTAWRQLGENCAKYLVKGKKVAVSGELHGRQYETKDGKFGFSLEVMADDVEFLSPRDDDGSGSAERYTPANSGSSAPRTASNSRSEFVNVDDDDLPF